jgi:hypothetical protein
MTLVSPGFTAPALRIFSSFGIKFFSSRVAAASIDGAAKVGKTQTFGL